MKVYEQHPLWRHALISAQLIALDIHAGRMSGIERVRCRGALTRGLMALNTQTRHAPASTAVASALDELCKALRLPGASREERAASYVVYMAAQSASGMAEVAELIHLPLQAGKHLVDSTPGAREIARAAFAGSQAGMSQQAHAVGGA